MGKRWIAVWFLALGFGTAWAGPGADGFLPREALDKLGRSAESGCPDCARGLRAEAFGTLTSALPPGTRLETSPGCLLVRTPGCGPNELALTCHAEEEAPPDGEAPAPPLVVFRFHTAGEHLAGVDPDDYTQASLDDVYRGSPGGTLFAGSVELVAFRYGDGPAFLYDATQHRLQIHCRLLALTPAP
jgi:hypothetical protein